MAFEDQKQLAQMKQNRKTLNNLLSLDCRQLVHKCVRVCLIAHFCALLVTIFLIKFPGRNEQERDV